MCTFCGSLPSIDVQGIGPAKETAGVQENPETVGFVLKVVRSCPGSGGSGNQERPDLSPASWASKVNSGPPFQAAPAWGPSLTLEESHWFLFLAAEGAAGICS